MGRLLLFKLFFSRFQMNFKKIVQDSIQMSEVLQEDNCSSLQDEVLHVI